MIKAVIFDWGGVIAPNPSGGWLGVLAEMLGTTVRDLLPYWHEAGYEDLSRGTVDETEFFRLLEQSLGHPLPADVSRIWVDGSAFEPWPDMLSYIHALKDRQFKVGLLSNTVEPMSRVASERGLYNGFEPLILSDAVGLVKPELPIYQMALDVLGVTAEECLYIDDLPKNLEPAKLLGMSTVLANDDPLETISLIEQALTN